MSLAIFEVDFVLKPKAVKVCLLFLEFKLNTKQDTAKKRIHLFLFIKYITKKLLKGNYWTCRWVKMNKAVEENILKIVMTRF